MQALPVDITPAAGLYERWSPDGRYLVSSQEGDLWLRDARTGQSRKLTATPDRWELMPAWAPDGKRLAFVSRPLEPGEGGRSWTAMHGCFCGSPTVVNSDGSGYQVLAEGSATNPPSWSPDGSELAFEQRRGQIAAFDFRAGRVKSVPVPGMRFVSAPAFSPVRNEIAFFFSESAVEPSRAQVLGGTAPKARQGYALLNRQTGKVRVLHEYRAPFSPRPPAEWSANGRRVALNLTCQLYLCDPVGLYVIDLAERKRELLTRDAYQAVWEPGGHRLAYLANGDRRTVQVFTFTTGGWERKSLRLDQLAEGMAWRPAAPPTVDMLTVHVGDTDGNGRPDRLAIPRPAPGQEHFKGPVYIFRAGDSRPHRLTHGGDFRRVEQVADVNGDGRLEVVTSYESHGSGGNITWFFHQWDGGSYRRIFDAVVSNWRGPNDLQIAPGQVTITCRPMGTYDHKHSPHRQHREVWRWNGSAFRLASHQMPPAATARQGVNDAEAYFRRQDYAEALKLYKRARTLPREEGDRDWQPHIRLRIRQAQALLERRPVPDATDLPPEVKLQSALEQRHPSLPFDETTHVDLDGDGPDEVWVRSAHPPAAFLAVRTPHGWRAGEVPDAGPEPIVGPAPDGQGGKVLIFRKTGSDWPDRVALGWNGREVRIWSEGGDNASHWTRPLQTPAVEPCREPIQWLQAD